MKIETNKSVRKEKIHRRRPSSATVFLDASMSLRFDPIYEPIARRFHKDPQAFADAFARAWFKLTHRDMGPRSRYLCPEVPKERLIWQDPMPSVDHKLIFFVNLLDMGTSWKPTTEERDVFEGRDRATGELKWTGTRVDLVFGSNSRLRALAEVYACEDTQKKFVQDFIAVWNKVMNADRFDLA